MSTPDFVAAAPFGAYIFLGLMCVIGAAWVYFFVPETKVPPLLFLLQCMAEVCSDAGTYS